MPVYSQIIHDNGNQGPVVLHCARNCRRMAQPGWRDHLPIDGIEGGWVGHRGHLPGLPGLCLLHGQRRFNINRFTKLRALHRWVAIGFLQGEACGRHPFKNLFFGGRRRNHRQGADFPFADGNGNGGRRGRSRPVGFRSAAQQPQDHPQADHAKKSGRTQCQGHPALFDPAKVEFGENHADIKKSRHPGEPLHGDIWIPSPGRSQVQGVK